MCLRACAPNDPSASARLRIRNPFVVVLFPRCFYLALARPVQAHPRPVPTRGVSIRLETLQTALLHTVQKTTGPEKVSVLKYAMYTRNTLHRGIRFIPRKRKTLVRITRGEITFSDEKLNANDNRPTLCLHARSEKSLVAQDVYAPGYIMLIRAFSDHTESLADFCALQSDQNCTSA